MEAAKFLRGCEFHFKKCIKNTKCFDNLSKPKRIALRKSLRDLWSICKEHGRESLIFEKKLKSFEKAITDSGDEAHRWWKWWTDSFFGLHFEITFLPLGDVRRNFHNTQNMVESSFREIKHEMGVKRVPLLEGLKMLSDMQYTMRNN